eukprot:3290669-Amphidinium_carterae.1
MEGIMSKAIGILTPKRQTSEHQHQETTNALQINKTDTFRDAKQRNNQHNETSILQTRLVMLFKYDAALGLGLILVPMHADQFWKPFSELPLCG